MEGNRHCVFGGGGMIDTTEDIRTADLQPRSEPRCFRILSRCAKYYTATSDVRRGERFTGSVPLNTEFCN
jgi:hypothetical protein